MPIDMASGLFWANIPVSNAEKAEKISSSIFSTKFSWQFEKKNEADLSLCVATINVTFELIKLTSIAIR